MSARLRLSAALSAERRRTKERLEASLGGLCELELLKHRQEARVRGALLLLLGDGPAPTSASPDGQPRSSVRCAPWALVAGLDQQVSDLKVKPPPWCGGGAAAACVAPLSSDDFAVDEDACPEPSQGTAAPGSPSSPRETAEARTSEPSEQSHSRDTGNPPRENPLSLKLETYIFGLLQRGCVPTRPCKTRTGPPHEARGVGLNPVRHSAAVCHKENNDSSDRASGPHALCSEARPKPPQRERQAQDVPRLQQQQPQRHAAPYPKAGPADAVDASLPHPPPGETTAPFPDSSDSDPDAPQHFQKYQPPFKSAAPPSADEQLVSAEYIPAQPCGASSRAYAHYLSAPQRGSAAAKAGRGAYSPERSQLYQEQPHSTSHPQASRPRGGTKKARSHDDKNGCGRKQGKKKWENGPQRGPERRYNTAERDAGAGAGAGAGAAGRGTRAAPPRSRKQQEGSGGSQRCHSTAELGPDRAEPPPPPHLSSACGQREHAARRPRRPQPAHTPPYALHPQHSLHQHFHHQQHPEHQGPPCPRPGPGESESSTSEADSPESSSSSSDSDESAGLVWPQQLSPQLALPARAAAPGAHLQPKAFVKIKASHALKKKILRFRTGSLKVMTTV